MSEVRLRQSGHIGSEVPIQENLDDKKKVCFVAKIPFQ
jgi:hypothetical protein